MKTNKLMIATLLASMSIGAGAQTSFDAAKLYEEELNGTARYVGMGGAMGALGSDPSVISHNPAGIGTYRKSDINTTLSFWGAETGTSPLATVNSPLNSGMFRYYSSNPKSGLHTNFDNFSVIFSGYDGSDSYMNFGLSYRKLQNMDREINYSDSYFDAQGDERWRDYNNHLENRLSSLDLNLSANFSDMLYLGWTVGFQFGKTNSNGFLYDFYPAGLRPGIDDVEDIEAADFGTDGVARGWNMAFGMILRPITPLRLGVAVKTPTYLKENLIYQDDVYAFGGQAKGVGADNEIDYKFISPWSLDLSAGITVAQTAIGVEYEKHFTQRSSLSVGGLNLVNQGSPDFQDYSVLKIGLEQNVKNLSFRVGYNYKSPSFKDGAYKFVKDTWFNGWVKDENGDDLMGRFDNQTDARRDAHYCTLGLGYCSKPDRDGTQFYFDMAYVFGRRYSDFNMNEYDEDMDIRYKYDTNKVMMTLGWNF